MHTPLPSRPVKIAVIAFALVEAVVLGAAILSR